MRAIIHWKHRFILSRFVHEPKRFFKYFLLESDICLVFFAQACPQWQCTERHSKREREGVSENVSQITTTTNYVCLTFTPGCLGIVAAIIQIMTFWSCLFVASVHTHTHHHHHHHLVGMDLPLECLSIFGSQSAIQTHSHTNDSIAKATAGWVNAPIFFPHKQNSPNSNGFGVSVAALAALIWE